MELVLEQPIVDAIATRQSLDTDDDMRARHRGIDGLAVQRARLG
jgi:hypothetical protein